jgi:hypothetical protein
LSRCYQLNKWSLPLIVARYSPSLEIERHHREWSEVKGHVIMGSPAGPTWYFFDMPVRLNIDIVNCPVLQGIIRSCVRGVESATN